MSEQPPFWQEVRRSLMVRGDGWKPVIEDLPNHISIEDAKQLLQSADQLTYLAGYGYIAGKRIDTKLDRDVVLRSLPSGLSLENAALQWLYRFIIVEAMVEHVRTVPMADWPPMFLHTVEEGLHFMVVMATTLVLIEEGKIGFDWDWHEWGKPGKTQDYPGVIRKRVAEACQFLHPKAQDYGESFRRHGLPGVLPRLWDKIARYAQLKADNRDGNFEKREDSARDLLGYSIIAYSLMLELPADFRKSYQPTSVYETDSNVMEGAEWRKVK